MPGPVQTVHLVAKTHLDLGFTALASEVEDRYLAEFFPRALTVAGELEAAGGTERLVWTTGSWIVDRALADPVGERAAAVAAGIEAGHLAWHALPLTTHTELMDAALVRRGLSISQRMDERFARGTTAAKMTDVPGHTRGLVSLLAEAGVTFLHLGVNPAWPVPEVPPVFRWRAPDGAEVTVAYQAGGYGGEVVVPGCPDVLAFLHAGDNLGPPTAQEVVAAHAELAARYPGAEVRASTLDAFARAVAASGAEQHLPVVTAEIGDPWLFGAGSDPQKLAAYRDVLRRRSVGSAGSVGPRSARAATVDDRVLLMAEHTWGLDQKVALPGDVRWSAADLATVRATPEGQRFEASWAEQRAYVAEAASALDGGSPEPGPPPIDPITQAARDTRNLVAAWASYEPGTPGVTSVRPGEVVVLGDWSISVDAATGALAQLVDPEGRGCADATHPLGLVRHQTFAEADYERFYAQLSPTPEDEWWARWDNTKPGIDAAGARSGWADPSVVRWLRVEPPASVLPMVLVELAFPPESVALGAPPQVWTRWAPSVGGDALVLEVAWPDKPASRLPEATWVSFVPVVAEPDRWVMDKLGQAVSPLDVVRRGGRSLHAVGEGVAYDGPDGRLVIATADAPLVAPGAPNLLDADPPVPDLAGGWHVLLHDNCWGTNFPMWNEGPARYRFTLTT